MRHVLMSLDAMSHGVPASLKVMRAEKVPIRVGEGLPIDLRIVPDVQGVHSMVGNLEKRPSNQS